MGKQYMVLSVYQVINENGKASSKGVRSRIGKEYSFMKRTSVRCQLVDRSLYTAQDMAVSFM